MPPGTGTASGGPFLSVAKERGKERQQEPRFLHLLARYTVCKLATACRTFTPAFSPRLVKRIVSAPAPLPLMPAPNNAIISTVAPHERQRRKKNVDASYKTITDMFCEREGKATKLKMRYSVRGSLNRRFKWRFWLLLPPRAKVTRAGARNTPYTPYKNSPLQNAAAYAIIKLYIRKLI